MTGADAICYAIALLLGSCSIPIVIAGIAFALVCRAIKNEQDGVYSRRAAKS